MFVMTISDVRSCRVCSMTATVTRRLIPSAVILLIGHQEFYHLNEKRVRSVSILKLFYFDIQMNSIFLDFCALYRQTQR